MIITRTIQELNDLLKSQAGCVGFVPTMGALHSGHISLITKSVEECDTTVASVFVNPTQFNDKNDLLKYPRCEEKDFEMLEKAGCNIVFAPSVEEMYPTEDTRNFNFGTLESVMEGASRPGHFNGVAQIVSKLFDAVNPDKAFFGEKDFQQVAIIRQMCKDLNYKVQIIACPILRAEDGLALSSRNMLLSEEDRALAPVISMTLRCSPKRALQDTVTGTKEWVIEQLESNDKIKVDYYEIVDSNTLQSIENWDDAEEVQGCVAITLGGIRLIDNICYKK